MEQLFLFTHITHAENFTIFDTKWIPHTTKFIALGARANGTGLIKVLELNCQNSQIDVVREINKKNAFKCSAFGLSRCKSGYLSIGDFGGSLQIINVERLDGGVYSVENAHNGVINAIDTAGGVDNMGASEIVTGGQDGLVQIWDPRCNNASPVVQIRPIQESANSNHDCWAVAFGNSYNRVERSVCAGFDNGDIWVYDLSARRIRWQSNVRNGVCGLEMNNKYGPLDKLVATTTFGGLNLFNFTDVADDQPTVSCVSKMDADEWPNIQRNHNHDQSHKEITPTIWCVRHLPQNRNIFATCGGSGNLRLWHSPKGQPLNALKTIYELSVSNNPVNCFDWHPDRTGLAVCGSFDKTIRIIASINLPSI